MHLVAANITANERHHAMTQPCNRNTMRDRIYSSATMLEPSARLCSKRALEFQDVLEELLIRTFPKRRTRKNKMCACFLRAMLLHIKQMHSCRQHVAGLENVVAGRELAMLYMTCSMMPTMTAMCMFGTRFRGWPWLTLHNTPSSPCPFRPLTQGLRSL